MPTASSPDGAGLSRNWVEKNQVSPRSIGPMTAGASAFTSQ